MTGGPLSDCTDAKCGITSIRKWNKLILSHYEGDCSSTWKRKRWLIFPALQLYTEVASSLSWSTGSLFLCVAGISSFFLWGTDTWVGSVCSTTSTSVPESPHENSSPEFHVKRTRLTPASQHKPRESPYLGLESSQNCISCQPRQHNISDTVCFSFPPHEMGHLQANKA